MNQFVVRPALDGSGGLILEFLGDHRAEGFPSVMSILDRQLSGFMASGSEPAPDDFLWVCSYLGGSFEISDDGCGLFILPRSHHAVVLADVTAALMKSGVFERVASNG